MSVRRECCDHCMWFGPLNKDGNMRKHRPATLDDKWGRPNQVQDMSAEPCPGSNKPYARFGTVAQAAEDAQTDTKQEPTVSETPAPKTTHAKCWVCDQRATYTLSREGSITLHACTHHLNVDQAEAERLGWAVTPIRVECFHGFGAQPGVTLTIPCKPGNRGGYGVFNDEGMVDRSDCAVQAANNAAFFRREDDGDTEYVVDFICPDHDEQPKGTCEECAIDGGEEDEDAPQVATSYHVRSVASGPHVITYDVVTADGVPVSSGWTSREGARERADQLNGNETS